MKIELDIPESVIPTLQFLSEECFEDMSKIIKFLIAMEVYTPEEIIKKFPRLKVSSAFIDKVYPPTQKSSLKPAKKPDETAANDDGEVKDWEAQ